MSILLALLAALGLGTADFFAGLASRRVDFRLVSAIAQSLGLLAAAIAVLFASGDGLTGRALLWGSIAGVGTGIGTMLLYRGLSIGRMAVVATLSGLIGAVIPVLVGLARGDSLSALSAAGIVIAVPAIALVSWQPASEEEDGGSGAIWGILAGLGFALFYVALDRAGDDTGAWPLAVNQAVAVAVAGSLALPALHAGGIGLPRPGRRLALAAGLGLATGLVALQAAFSSGELAIVVVLTSLYPGVTILLARFGLDERWVRTQKIGLFAALAAVIMVSAGAS
jgi:drug/metabolite transporter (DMT)-like permease